ncbi:MAG: DUF6728 family protein [Salibacteraceae bacterium]
MFWKKLLYYINPFTLFSKEKEGEKKDFSLKTMHGMNRISVLVFLASLFVMFYRIFLR